MLEHFLNWFDRHCASACVTRGRRFLGMNIAKKMDCRVEPGNDDAGWSGWKML
jgi:hypothetical protein